MKKIAISLVTAVLLVACASPSGDMLNNQFTSIVAQPSNISGIWSGSNGPYLVTYKINADGTGLMCSSWQDKNTVSRIKVADGIFYGQDGLKQAITQASSNSLVLHTSYLTGADYKYIPDPSLQNASPYCAKELVN